MKRVLLIGLLSSVSLADDFETSVNNVKAVSRKLDEKLYKLGIRTNRSDSPTLPFEAEKSKSKLITVYSSRQTRVASAGSYLFGRLESRVVVSSEPVPTVVRLRDNQGIFSGLKVLGLARASSIEARIDVDLTRLILASGETARIEAVALDTQGAKGLEASVLSSKALSVVGAMASSFVSGLAVGNQTQETNSLGFSQTKATGRNAVLQGVAQTAADQSKRLLDESTKEKPILIAEPGQEVTVYLSEDFSR